MDPGQGQGQGKAKARPSFNGFDTIEINQVFKSNNRHSSDIMFFFGRLICAHVFFFVTLYILVAEILGVFHPEL